MTPKMGSDYVQIRCVWPFTSFHASKCKFICMVGQGCKLEWLFWLFVFLFNR